MWQELGILCLLGILVLFFQRLAAVDSWLSLQFVPYLLQLMEACARSSGKAFRGKDELEKARLKNRSGGFFRYEDVQNPIAVLKGPSFGCLQVAAWIRALIPLPGHSSKIE